jgi:tRNA 2-thiouridine synthesizing protein A
LDGNGTQWFTHQEAAQAGLEDLPDQSGGAEPGKPAYTHMILKGRELSAPEPDAADPADTFVDARGHRCPMPLLMAKRALNGLAVGQSVVLAATDPSSIRDFEVFARQSGHELLEAREADGEFLLRIRKR